jgi:hypothetical protein
MSYKIINYEEANSRFNVKEIFLELHSMYEEAARFFEKAILYEGDTILENLIETDYCEQGSLIIVNGNLEVKNGIRTYGDDYGLSGILVLGNVTSQNLTLGCTNICITGNLTLSEYLYTIRPPFESGVLETKGEINVPFIIQADYNPQILGKKNGRTKIYGPDDLEDIEGYDYNAYDFSITNFIDFLKKREK